ncbi:MAG: serine hydrolase domain-containing protein [Acidimicrobiia bacterium]
MDGWVATEFAPVLDAFGANFDERGEVGAAVSVYLDGRPVVDLWGGLADPIAARPWVEDTIVPVFSCTKGVTAVCANLLIERGELDPDAPVASYWPEFAANGKDAITVRVALSHRAGLPLVEGDFTLDDVCAWDPIVEQLARQAPIWEPGTQHGYHMRTYGWITGELIRRITGVSPGTFLRKEVADPLDLSCWIGLPESEEPRVAHLVPPDMDMRAALAPLRDKLLLARVFGNPSDLFTYDEMWNTRQMHACELPSSNGIGDARSLARLYASCIQEGVDGVRTLHDVTVQQARIEQVRGPDAVIMVESAYGLGFMLGSSFGAANPPNVFGHAGAGGSLAFADPEVGVSFGYVMNDLRFGADGDPRSESLVRAMYEAVGRLGR